MKFIVGLLLGLILGIGGTAAFLITAGGGDYLVVTSPRVRELETSLKQADQEREWLRGQLRGSNEMLVKLESRFVGLAARFEDLGSQAATLLGAPPTEDETTSGAPKDDDATPLETSSASPSPTSTPGPSPSPAPTETLAAGPVASVDADDDSSTATD